MPLIAGPTGTAHAEWSVVTDCFGAPLPAWPGQTIVIHGYNDDDVLRGGAMRDYIYGGDDTDAIYGGPGDDYIDCGPGNNDSADGGTHVVGGAADVDELAPNHGCYSVTNVP